MNNKLGGPAFPTLDKFYPEPGMSLRDYFAAKAMQSLITQIYNPEYNSVEEIAKWSYEFADAMINESQKRTETANTYLRAMIFLLKELSIILNLENPSSYEIIEEVRKLKENQK